MCTVCHLDIQNGSQVKMTNEWKSQRTGLSYCQYRSVLTNPALLGYYQYGSVLPNVTAVHAYIYQCPPIEWRQSAAQCKNCRPVPIGYTEYWQCADFSVGDILTITFTQRTNNIHLHEMTEIKQILMFSLLTQNVSANLLTKLCQ